MANTHNGSCFCGAVQFTVTGEPAAMGYCHCNSCRQWSAGPVNAFSLWKPESFRITRGAEHVGSYSKSPQTHRKWCKLCGGHLYGEHPGLGFVDVFAPLIPSLQFKPGAHINYQESVMRVKDGLPKLKDFPKEFGGSGEMLAE